MGPLHNSQKMTALAGTSVDQGQQGWQERRSSRLLCAGTKDAWKLMPERK